MSKTDMSVEMLAQALEAQELRLTSLNAASVPSREELQILDCFWNPNFHTLRDWVPLDAIVDVETQRLTSRNDCPMASALIRARVKTLMSLGLIGDEIVEFSGGKPSHAKLWLTTKGATHFATGVPAFLRQPLLYARRHLTLFQLLAVAVTIVIAIATFIARLLGWVA